MRIEDARHFVQLRSNIEKSCELCDFRIKDVAAGVNHYVQQHNSQVFHLGSEHMEDSAGSPTFATVAMVGGNEVPGAPPKDYSISFA